jgi:5-methylcytosine-specific restriction endonuclease McrBC regulatory subunit McrC
LTENKNEKDNEYKNILSNLREKTDDELRKILDDLYVEEEKLSYKRRILHGKIDILRAELTERLKQKHAVGESIISGNDIKKLSEILAKGTSRRPKADLSKEKVFD